MAERKSFEETAAPARNFTITLEDKIRAAGGPPAYMRRKRAIEDLEDELLRNIRKLRDRHPIDDDFREALAADVKVKNAITEVNRLVRMHNRYYPAEANLPLHPRTRVWIENGQPWRPLPSYRLEDLVQVVVNATRSPAPQ